MIRAFKPGCFRDSLEDLIFLEKKNCKNPKFAL
jgi:hypothetical protein